MFDTRWRCLSNSKGLGDEQSEYIIKNKWIIIVHKIPQKGSLPPIISEKINFEWIDVCMSSDIQGIEHPLFVNEQKLMTIFIIINF